MLEECEFRRDCNVKLQSRVSVIEGWNGAEQRWRNITMKNRKSEGIIIFCDASDKFMP